MDFMVLFTLCRANFEKSRRHKRVPEALSKSQAKLLVTQASYTLIIAEVHFSRFPTRSRGLPFSYFLRPVFVVVPQSDFA